MKRIVPVFVFVLALALALPAIGEERLDHYRLVNIVQGFDLAEELERAGYGIVEGGSREDSVELHVTPTEVAELVGMGFDMELISIGRPFLEIQAERLAALAAQPGQEGVPAG